MTKFERAVLQVLARSSEALGWYQIERRLSNTALDERPLVVLVLEGLVLRGWVQEATASEAPTKRYSVTPLGRGELEK
jgi:hypothetical protein